MWSENRTSFKPIKADLNEKKYRKYTSCARSSVRNRQVITTEPHFITGLGQSYSQ